MGWLIAQQAQQAYQRRVHGGVSEEASERADCTRSGTDEVPRLTLTTRLLVRSPTSAGGGRATVTTARAPFTAGTATSPGCSAPPSFIVVLPRLHREPGFPPL